MRKFEVLLKFLVFIDLLVSKKGNFKYSNILIKLSTTKSEIPDINVSFKKFEISQK